MRRACSLVACLSIGAALGCSVGGLGDFDIGTCSESELAGRSPCQVLDERDGIPEEACLHWQCSRAGRGCELRPKDYDDDGHADAERCGRELAAADDCDDEDRRRHGRKREALDGIDNNCDGTIDNQALAPCADAIEPIDVELDDASGDFALGPVAGAAGLCSATRNGRAALLDSVAGRSTPIMFDSAAAVGRSSAKPCPTPDGNQACNARELALTSIGNLLVGAAVSDNAGCSDGELRIGLGLAADVPLRLWLGGNERDASNVTNAVDRGRARCPELGVRRPAIAGVSSAGGAQALALWLAEPPRSTRACGESASVRALGLWVIAADRAIVRATDGGASQELGRTRGVAAPALIADAAGYIAGYPNDDGALELRFFDPLPSAAATAEPTPRLRMPVPQQFASAGPIDFVALSLDASGERLAAAFRVGCGEQAHLQFSTFELERPLARARSAELRTELSLDSFAGAPIVDGPVVVHVSRGFRVTERGDASSGGWLVSWIVREGDATKLLAARISEDGALLDSPALEVAPALFDRMVAFSAAGDRVSYLGVNYTTDRLERTTILCNAR